MKKGYVVYGLCVACMGVACGVWMCRSFGMPSVVGLRIGYINSSIVKDTARPFVRVKAWLEKQCQQTQDELDKKIIKLQKVYEWVKLRKMDNSNTERYNQFRQEVSQLENAVQKRKEDMMQQCAAISQFLEGKLKEIVARLSCDRCIDIVLNQNVNEVQSILYSQPSSQSVLDVTEAVVTLLNEDTENLQLPDLPLWKEILSHTAECESSSGVGE